MMKSNNYATSTIAGTVIKIANGALTNLLCRSQQQYPEQINAMKIINAPL